MRAETVMLVHAQVIVSDALISVRDSAWTDVFVLLATWTSLALALTTCTVPSVSRVLAIVGIGAGCISRREATLCAGGNGAARHLDRGNPIRVGGTQPVSVHDALVAAKASDTSRLRQLAVCRRR